MKLKLLFLFIIFSSVTIYAQDYKWSVEVNYPISVGDKLGNDDTGIIDVGVKYRFLDLNLVKIGVGANVGLFRDNIVIGFLPETYNFDETDWLIQPKIFAEFKVPTLEKWSPSIGLGYTFVETRLKDNLDIGNVGGSYSTGDLNLSLGLSYDISKRFFAQAQYDYMKQKTKFEKRNQGFLKFGFGFKF